MPALKKIWQDQLDLVDGHLQLSTLLRSGNIVPKDIGFYYIEPGVEQTISYLTLIREPNEFLKVNGKFSFEEERIFPTKVVGSKNLIAHSAESVIELNSNRE
jgi:hypothetical protein